MQVFECSKPWCVGNRDAGLVDEEANVCHGAV